MSLDVSDWTTAGLWLAVVASGIYHGINPGMGWPLAVSAALLGRSRREFWHALAALAAGHFVAMISILAPFTVLTVLIQWQTQIRVAAALVIIAVGVFLFIVNRHPRILSRIPPTRLALWSFLAATAHGAGLMLVPIYLGLCKAGEQDAGHIAAGTLMAGNLGTALIVSVVHATAMIVSGGTLAWIVYRWLGPGFVSKSWFNLDRIWAASLVLVGLISLATV